MKIMLSYCNKNIIGFTDLRHTYV